jgi:hypothetical protein
MQNDVSPVAARNDAAQLDTTQLDATKAQSDANLHVQVGPATKRFHFWQQAPSWLLGFAAIGLGFLMVLRGYDSSAGWFAVSTGVILSVVGSYRSPFSIGETAISTSPGKKAAKKVTPPAA